MIMQSKGLCGSVKVALKMDLLLKKSLFHLDESIIGTIRVAKNSQLHLKSLKTIELRLFRIIFVDLPDVNNKKIKQELINHSIQVKHKEVREEEEYFLIPFEYAMDFKTVTYPLIKHS